MPTSKSLWLWLVAILFGGTVVVCSGLCLFAIGLSALAARAQKQALAAPPDVLAEYDVPYGAAEGEELVMDIARPRNGNGPYPAIVCIHGGGWRGGDKIIYRAFIHQMAQRGFVAASIRY